MPSKDREEFTAERQRSRGTEGTFNAKRQRGKEAKIDLFLVGRNTAKEPPRVTAGRREVGASLSFW
jgi:hypothetical protein